MAQNSLPSGVGDTGVRGIRSSNAAVNSDRVIASSKRSRDSEPKMLIDDDVRGHVERSIEGSRKSVGYSFAGIWIEGRSWDIDSNVKMDRKQPTYIPRLQPSLTRILILQRS